ncbi:MAG TPA: aminotransferase class IV [Kofleriaceae bacterium]|nr:aminotransferase class IV [Kofleriaceae bacterium]
MVAVSIDGTIVSPEQAKISVFDRGVLYGDGCFEVLRTWDGVARDLDAHLDRLFDTARFLGLKHVDRGKLTEDVYRTIAHAGASAPGEHRIRIVLTRGPGAIGVRFSELPAGHAIVIVEPLHDQPRELSLAVVDWPITAHGPGRKTLAYLEHLIARELAAAAGADEAVRLDARGNVVECATSNLFVVSHAAVVTPPTERGALPGVVRARVIALCGKLGITSHVRDISRRELRGADEIFVTSSLRGIVPITKLDGVDRRPGPVTARLAQAYAVAMRTAT